MKNELVIPKEIEDKVEAIRETLRIAIKKRGGFTALGKALGYPNGSAVGKIVNGDTKALQLSKLLVICGQLGISFTDVINNQILPIDKRDYIVYSIPVLMFASLKKDNYEDDFKTTQERVSVNADKFEGDSSTLFAIHQEPPYMLAKTASVDGRAVLIIDTKERFVPGGIYLCQYNGMPILGRVFSTSNSELTIQNDLTNLVVTKEEQTSDSFKIIGKVKTAIYEVA